MVTQAEIDAVPWRKTEYIAPHEYIIVMDYPDLVDACMLGFPPSLK